MSDTDLYKGKYRIESTRLKEWDYSSAGYYFVAICTKNWEFIFGSIAEDKVKLTGIGKIAKRYWLEISEHFQNVKLDEYIIMPNHLHGILVIENQSRDAINRVSTDKGGITKSHNPMLSENSLSKIMRWYKARSTFEINKMRGKLRFTWQSRFYDHVIRNEESLLRIREYIHRNPLKWDIDENNPVIFLKKG
jgi:REP element-mobilizing transposase RayT